MTTTKMITIDFEKQCALKIDSILGLDDPAHDLAHVLRVVKNAKTMSEIYKANLNVVVPAAYLHDFVNLSKDSPLRKKASLLSADKAILFLKSIDYPEKYFTDIHHAICAHSFSAQIKPETIEAQILQDADRLDALGAIGLARLFAVSSQLKRPFYDLDDPLAAKRELDDKKFGIDHIFVKLQKIALTMNTQWAKEKAQQRFNFIELYINELKKEII